MGEETRGATSRFTLQTESMPPSACDRKQKVPGDGECRRDSVGAMSLRQEGQEAPDTL